jgi:riboflavin synthase
MFTGIVRSVGTVTTLQRKGHEIRLSLDPGRLDLAAVKAGDSLAVSGVCLTVAQLLENGFEFDVSQETLSRTTLGKLQPGTRVNLEPALTLSTPLGGHLVSGHCDGVGAVLERRPIGESVRLSIQAPLALAKYIAEKGSICVDGVSLTVNQVQGNSFEVNIVPYTLQETTLKEYTPGRMVNLEVDLLARYVERLWSAEVAPANRDVIDEAFLARYGFRK